MYKAYEATQRGLSVYRAAKEFSVLALRKHVYSNILKISPPKTESFQTKILIFFIFLLKTEIMGTR